MLSGKAALQCWERRVEGLRNQRGQGRGGCRLALEGLCMRGTRGVIGMGVGKGSWVADSDGVGGGLGWQMGQGEACRKGVLFASADFSHNREYTNGQAT